MDEHEVLGRPLGDGRESVLLLAPRLFASAFTAVESASTKVCLIHGMPIQSYGHGTRSIYIVVALLSRI